MSKVEKVVGSEVRVADLVPGDMFEGVDGRRFVVLALSKPVIHAGTGEPILTSLKVRYRPVGARNASEGNAAMRAYDRNTVEPKVATYAGRAPGFNGA